MTTAPSAIAAAFRELDVVWFVRCDEPGCTAIIGSDGATDREAIEAVTEYALQRGWQIAPDRFVRPRLDLCPEHRKGNG